MLQWIDFQGPWGKVNALSIWDACKFLKVERGTMVGKIMTP